MTYIDYLEFVRICNSAIWFSNFDDFKFCFGNYADDILRKAWKKAKGE